MPGVIKAYKGFDKDFKCRGVQFVVGETYHHTDEVKACYSGFHACTDLFDVWKYYDPSVSRYAEVECSGTIDTHNGDSKVACQTIKIVREFSLTEFLKIVTDREVAKAASGHGATLAASGYGAKLAASGYGAKLAASCSDTMLSASGSGAALAAAGSDTTLAAAGSYTTLAASGSYTTLAASGSGAALAASGYGAKLAASGLDAALAASGSYTTLAASGHGGVISASGTNTTASGVNGTWISLAEYDNDYKCIGFAVGCIGQDGLEENVPYMALGGKLVPLHGDNNGE